MEACARALIHRGRPSLTAPGVHSKARQVRLPDTLDARLEQYVAQTHTPRNQNQKVRTQPRRLGGAGGQYVRLSHEPGDGTRVRSHTKDVAT